MLLSEYKPYVYYYTFPTFGIVTLHVTMERFAQCPPRVFSGIQPTGVPHLGNYLCAIRKWVEMQEQYDSMLVSVVDLHSITVPQDATELRENILVMAACLMACGIDHEKTILFQQSSVSYHTELAWILGCLCTLPRLGRLPQWREKSKTVKDPGIGLFTYPILQTADILLYKANVVPVGEDQIIHLELATDLARAFNRTYGIMFPSPEALIGDVSKVRSLKDPTCKMSKSDVNSMSRIDLTDSADLVQSKIKKSTTDSVSRILTYDPENRPGISNLIDIHSLLTDTKPEDIVHQCKDLNKVQYKERVSEIINETIQPINEKMTRLLNDKHYLHTVLKKGAERASEIADRTMTEVKDLVGLR
ncbi:tryptophan--tRNA ligase, mitochondrial-like isoform X2 [Mercenaria mercenaria]|uniref:tryptophan--tRNA ligase, mitochondrial-like isoform X2 n=1 Tax=Mercenaria mercenaria TaxID=6596 RepID=UPI00234E4E73|nr:tryptophan--tRNA ligase, mitochondrial-like isoform X2 [Mercenaria mercenaria]